MRIEKKEYEDAIMLIKAYHAQLENELESGRQESSTEAKCTGYGYSERLGYRFLTVGKIYPILKSEITGSRYRDRFLIKDDCGKKRWYKYYSNRVFELL